MLGRNLFQRSARSNFGVRGRHWGVWLGVGAGLVWLSPACLNPHTDDQPTFAGDSTTVFTPGGESCNDNPLLAGCNDGLADSQPINTGSSSAAGGTGAGAPAQPASTPGADGLQGAAGSGGMPASEQAGGAPDAGTGDAGTGDANAP